MASFWKKIIPLLFFAITILSYSQGTFLPNKSDNEKKLYYPKVNDKFWFTYEPNLTGAEGWVVKDCQDKNLIGKKIIVLFELLEHRGRGYYKGKLYVKTIETSKELYIDYNCFKPNYEKGDWLGPKLQIPSKEDWYNN